MTRATCLALASLALNLGTYIQPLPAQTPSAAATANDGSRHDLMQGGPVPTSWDMIAPPSPAEGPDTVPKFTKTLREIGRLDGLPDLRATPPADGAREIRLWVGFGLGVPDDLLRIRVSKSGIVSGELIEWVDVLMPQSGAPADRWSRFLDSLRRSLARSYGCRGYRSDTIRALPIGTDVTPVASPPPRLAAACRASFRSEPNWSILLAKLEAHHVWDLPDEDRLPRFTYMMTDGVAIVVEAWNGHHYRTYAFGNPESQPAPEAGEAWKILRLVGEVVEHASRRESRPGSHPGGKRAHHAPTWMPDTLDLPALVPLAVSGLAFTDSVRACTRLQSDPLQRSGHRAYVGTMADTASDPRHVLVVVDSAGNLTDYDDTRRTPFPTEITISRGTGLGTVGIHQPDEPPRMLRVPAEVLLQMEQLGPPAHLARAVLAHCL